MEAKKIKDVLTSGFSEEENEFDFSDSIPEVTTDLYYAFKVSDSRNYCEVDKTVKELSFVFVVCSKENHEDFDKKDSNLIFDSRNSVAREGVFGEEEYEIETVSADLLPAYLIIFG